MTRLLLLVFLGGGIGATLRGLLIDTVPAGPGRFPLPILIANLLGAYAIGVLFVLADEVGLMRSRSRAFLVVGVLGGFTTFSTLAWNVDTLLAGHDVLAGLVYMASSTAGGPLAVLVGIASGREAVGTMERLARGYIARLEGGREYAGPEERVDVTDRTGTGR